eukprot:472542_1
MSVVMCGFQHISITFQWLFWINVEQLEEQHIQDVQKQKTTKKKRKRPEIDQETECSAFEIDNGSTCTWECSNMNQIYKTTRRTSKRHKTTKYSNLKHCF